MCIAKLLKKINIGKGMDIPSPRVEIAGADIAYNAATRQVIISNIEPEVIISTVWVTNSMEPLIDVGHVTVCSNNPKYMSKAELNVGDILVWKQDTGATIIHSIVEIGEDERGWYCITEGINNAQDDQVKVRYSQIQSVVIMIIPTKTFGGLTPALGD